ncbi:hypothetical protein EK904_008997 [Melospiza melodia maxima]|nr:hypothetical protein EK904_008997 [Melospiza melodia maxima]
MMGLLCNFHECGISTQVSLYKCHCAETLDPWINEKMKHFHRGVLLRLLSSCICLLLNKFLFFPTDLLPTVLLCHSLEIIVAAFLLMGKNNNDSSKAFLLLRAEDPGVCGAFSRAQNKGFASFVFPEPFGVASSVPAASVADAAGGTARGQGTRLVPPVLPCLCATVGDAVFALGCFCSGNCRPFLTANGTVALKGLMCALPGGIANRTAGFDHYFFSMRGKGQQDFCSCLVQMGKETSPPSVFSHLDFPINQESLMHKRVVLCLQTVQPLFFDQRTSPAP